MKKHSLRYFIPVAAFFLLYACTKGERKITQAYSVYGSPANQGQLKVNLAFSYTVNTAIYLVKVNGAVVSNLLQGRTPFPGGGYNTNGQNSAQYLLIPLGTNTVSIIIPKVGTNTDSIVLYNTTINLPDANPYTLHITDTLVNATTNNTKSVLVKNIITPVDTGFCRFKFVNLFPGVPAVDLYLNGQLIKSNLAYLQPTDTFSVRTGVNAPGYVSGSTAIWAVRTAGAASTTTALASYVSNTPLSSQFATTIFTMGYPGFATGTPRAPFISFTPDKNTYP